MIMDLIAIFRARKRPRDATKLAVRFAHGQAIDRIATPIIIAQFALWGFTALMAVLVTLALLGATSLHGSIGLIGILPALIGLASGYLAIGIGKGLDSIKSKISELTDRSVDSLPQVRNDRTRITTDIETQGDGSAH